MFVTFRLIVVVDTPFHTIPSWSQIGAVVGVTTSVEPNQYNTIAEQLKNKEEELERREMGLQDLESNTIVGTQKADRLLQYLLGISSILLLLILYNFILDWRRGQRIRYSNT
jgi:hypothetical protein